jgi:hypothetical protein
VVVSDAVSGLRGRVVDAIIGTLPHLNPRAAVLAARALHEALRYPMDISEEDFQKWSNDFLQTFAKLEQAIRTENIDPIVLIEIAQVVSWHANYGREETRRAAKRILKSLPGSLEFRTLLTLVDGSGHLIERHSDYQKHEAEWNRHLRVLTAELLEKYLEGEALREFIERQIAHINAYCMAGTPYVLYSQLVNASPALSRATVADALARPDSVTKQFAWAALAKLMQQNPADGLDYAVRFAGSNSRDLQAAVGTTFGALDFKDRDPAPEELAVLQKVLGSKDERVARCPAGGIRTVANGDDKLTIELLKCVDIGISSDLADIAFMNFAFDHGKVLNAVTDDDIGLFLNRLMPLPKLDGHWVENFPGRCLGRSCDKVGQVLYGSSEPRRRQRRLELPALQLRTIWPCGSPVQGISRFQPNSLAGIGLDEITQ